MSRDTRRTGPGQMVNNSRQNNMVRDVAREKGISESKLSEAIHSAKDNWDSGDFSYSELREIADEIKKNGSY